MFRGLVLFGILVLAAHGAQALDTSMNETLPYADARRVLQARGFRPYVMPGAATCEEGDPRCYPELVGCVHKRHWICDYSWKAGESIFQAETNSEVPVVDSFYCLVNCTVRDHVTDNWVPAALPNAQRFGTEPQSHN